MRWLPTSSEPHLAMERGPSAAMDGGEVARLYDWLSRYVQLANRLAYGHRFADFTMHKALAVCTGDEAGEQVITNGGARDNLQVNRHSRTEIVFNTRRDIQRCPGAGKQCPPVVIDDEPLANAIEQLGAQHFLQLVQCGTRCGLG